MATKLARLAPAVQELRIHLCQTSQASEGVRCVRAHAAARARLSVARTRGQKMRETPGCVVGEGKAASAQAGPL